MGAGRGEVLSRGSWAASEGRADAYAATPAAAAITAAAAASTAAAAVLQGFNEDGDGTPSRLLWCLGCLLGPALPWVLAALVAALAAAAAAALAAGADADLAAALVALAVRD